MAGRLGLRRYFSLLENVQLFKYRFGAKQLNESWKVSRLWQVCAGQSTKLKLGSFLTTSLAASRGFSLWSKKEKDPIAVMEPAAAVDPDVAAAEEADRLYEDNKSQELYDHMIRYKDSKNADLLWRVARATRLIAQRSTTSPEDKKKLTYESLGYAERALKEDDKNYGSHKWYAICLSEVGDYEGTKQKISNAYIIREHFEKSIELNPKDATSHHLLGLWCYTFADLGWLQKKLAAAVFGTPPTATYKQALDKFLEAEDVSPNFYSKNLLMLGKTYQKMGDTKSALLWFTKARDYPAKTEEDNQVVKDAKDFLKSM